MDLKGYPVFLIGLETKKTIMIGGTHEAERKIAGLLEVDAQITVITPTATEQIEAWAGEGRVKWIKRDFQAGDVDGADLIIAERKSPEENAAIWEAAPKGALINIMDDIPHCNFIAGSVVKRGDLTIAISTNGAAPVVAVRLKEWLEEEIGDEYAVLLRLFRALREPIAKVYPAFNQRRALWYEMIDSDILDLIREGKEDQAVKRIGEILGEEVLNGSGLVEQVSR